MAVLLFPLLLATLLLATLLPLLLVLREDVCRTRESSVVAAAASTDTLWLLFARNRLDPSVHIGVQSRSVAVLVVALHQQTSRVLVQGTFRKGHNQQTPNHREHVRDRVRAFPVFLERVDANRTRNGIHVGVVDLGEEVDRRWDGRKRCTGGDAQQKELARVRRIRGSLQLDLLFVDLGGIAISAVDY